MQIGSTLDSVLFTLALVLIKSTSNHNKDYRHNSDFIVVSYRKTTSNHNSIDNAIYINMLYLMEKLHQTTTPCME